MNGTGGYDQNCYNDGLNNMVANTCYTMNPAQSPAPTWINPDVTQTFWWIVTACDGSGAVTSSSSATTTSSSSKASSILDQASQTHVATLLPGSGIRLMIESDAAQINVYNYLGMVVSTRSAARGLVQIPVEKSGMYFVRVQTRDGMQVLRTAVMR